ncbi:hypothetical protein BDW68DRAFT_178935 [Aspergillus falconensis]
MKDLLVNGRYSDMRITCQRVTFDVHRAIVCSQSHFFQAAMDGNFKESTTHTIDLPEDDPQTIGRMLCFLYTATYTENNGRWDDPDSPSKGPEPAMPKTRAKKSVSENAEDPKTGTDKNRSPAYYHLQVYLAADKYEIIPLKDLAARRFVKWCETNWDSDAFLETAQDAMTIIPEHDSTFLHALAKIIPQHIEYFMSDGRIASVFVAYGSLASAVIARMTEDKKRYKACIDLLCSKFERSCPKCYHTIRLRVGENGEPPVSPEVIRCGNCRNVL